MLESLVKKENTKRMRGKISLPKRKYIFHEFFLSPRIMNYDKLCEDRASLIHI